MLPIEVISAKDIFLLQARDMFNISNFRAEKRLLVSDIEHGLRLNPSGFAHFLKLYT